jgi:hypothetical protein
MGGRHDETLAAVFRTPAPANVAWHDIEALFVALGAAVTEGSGSRVRVALNGIRSVFHRPHPGKEAARATIRRVREFLTEAGIEP